MKYYLTLITLLFVFSCKEHADKFKTQDIALSDIKHEESSLMNASPAAADTTATPSLPEPPQAGDHSDNKTETKSSQSPESKPDWNKKIIKTGLLNVEIKDYGKFNKLVHNSVDQFGGYIAEEQQTQNDYKIENIITIKVPVDQFQKAVDFFTSGDGKINEKKITSEDVTSQYVDTKSRMEAKKQVRLRYLDLLKQAKNMEEVLQVQNEINSIQEEIESAAGRINYLTNASAMSTINLTFYQVVNESAKDSDEVSFWQKTKNAFLSGWNGIGDVLIGLTYIWPLIIAAVLLFVFVKKRYTLKKKSKNTQS